MAPLNGDGQIGAKTLASQFEYQVWLEAKRDEMEQSGLRRAAFASKFESMLGLIHTQSLVTR